MTQPTSKKATKPTRAKARIQPAQKRTAPRKTKSDLVREKLERANGARLEDLCKATGWQPHTVRAALSGLRKAGHVIERTRDDTGQSVYRITGKTGAGQ